MSGWMCMLILMNECVSKFDGCNKRLFTQWCSEFSVQMPFISHDNVTISPHAWIIYGCTPPPQLLIMTTFRCKISYKWHAEKNLCSTRKKFRNTKHIEVHLHNKNRCSTAALSWFGTKTEMRYAFWGIGTQKPRWNPKLSPKNRHRERNIVFCVRTEKSKCGT